MPETPRTWTLVGEDPSELPTIEAGPILVDEEIQVVELEPLLDLLKGVVSDLNADEVTDWSNTERAEALLRAHGRLPDQEEA